MFSRLWLIGSVNTYAYAHNNPVGKVDPTGLGPGLFLACTALNGIYGAYSVYDRAKQLDDIVSALRDQLDRVNERINECPTQDVDKLAELEKLRRQLSRDIASALAGDLSPSDTALGQAGTALVWEGLCGALFFAPTL